MTLFLMFLATHVCLPGQKAGQCGEIKIIRIRRSAFVFALLLTDIPQRRETGQCLHSRLITQRLSDSSMPLAFLQEGKMKAHRAHAPPMAPTFMWPTCAILTGISWHAFVSIILPQLISSSTRNRRFAYSILRFCAFTAPDVKWGVPATADAVGYRPGTNIYLVWADSHRWVNVE